MFQYKNSHIIGIIQINCNNLDDNNEAVLFFDLFFLLFSLKRLVLVCFGWWVVDWDKRFSLLLL